MKVLICGANGQLGRELTASAPAAVELVTPGREALDLTAGESVDRTVAEVAPRLVINAAAYNAVDRAEEERELAHAVNAEGVGRLARAAARADARLIHVSTDFVFSGDRGQPYRPEDRAEPLSVYGESKRAGELAALEATGGDALVVRTSWLYSGHRENFVRTMLRLLAERDEVRVVADQIGTPTWARGLARALWRFAARPRLSGVYHWTDAGVASWYDLACAVGEAGEALGLIQTPAIVRPIRAEEWPTAARRPAFSVLDSGASWEALDVDPVHWRRALADCLEDLARG